MNSPNKSSPDRDGPGKFQRLKRVGAAAALNQDWIAGVEALRDEGAWNGISTLF